METEVRAPGPPGLSAKLCLKGQTSKINLIPYSNPANRTMKKASLHVQQYTTMTAHPSRGETRVSLTPPHYTMRGWTQALKHARKTVTETYSQPSGWFFLSQDLTQLARLPLKSWICQPPASVSCVPGSTGLHFQANIPLHKHEAQTATKQERVTPPNNSYYTGNASSFLSEGAKKPTLFLLGFFSFLKS